MKRIAYGLIYIFLGLCVLAGAAAPFYLHYQAWMLLAFAALVGAAAGGIAPGTLRSWQAWIALVVPVWVGTAYVLTAMRPGEWGALICLWPAAASVGAAVGLVVWRLPQRLWFWRPVPLALGVGIVAGFWFLASMRPTPPYEMQVFRPFQAPAYTLALLDGRTLPSSQLNGKTVVLVFWATWCEPCRKEMPQLEALYRRRYAERPDVAIFLVDAGMGDETRAKARTFLKQHGITIPAAFDAEGRLSLALRLPRVLPARVVIGPVGRVRFEAYGYDAGDADFTALQKAIAAAAG